MKQPLFPAEVFAPAHVHWNKLILDPSRPHVEQLHQWYDDQIWAVFPNDVGIDISWHPEHKPVGEFVVSLVQNPYHWEPFAKRRCQTIPELRKIVSELVAVARERPSIRRPLIDEPNRHPGLYMVNKVILDPLTPLEFQIDALVEEMLDVRYINQARILTAGWFPGHLLEGEFRIEVRRDLRGEAERMEADGLDFTEELAAMPVVWSRRCRTIRELEKFLEEAHAFAKQVTTEDGG